MLQVAAAILLNEKSEIFIARRKEEKDLGGYWEFPGGKIEPGETAEICLKRELLEEFEIQAEIGNPFLQTTHQYPSKIVCIQSFFVTHLAGSFVLNDHDDYAFVKADQLLGYSLAPADMPIAKKLIKTITA